MANPYADMVAPPTNPYAGMVQGFTPLTAPNPKLPLELRHSQGEIDLQNAELRRQGSLTSKAASDAAEAAARAGVAGPLARAQLVKAQADAAVAQQNAAGAAATSMGASSNVHGSDYLKTLPGSLASVVKGVASGNVMLPANALKVPYWQQVLQHVLDPEFNAADFNTRARTRQDFANGKAGISITALNTALGHAGEVLSDVNALGNKSGWLTSAWNPIANAYLRHSGDPRVTNFENDTMAFGGELGKVFSGASGGGQGEREEWRTSIPLNGSPEQQRGVLTHDAKLLRSRIEAINEQYKRGMGRTADISDLLDPHARQVYSTLLGGDGSASESPVRPGGGNGNPPSAGGQPGSAPLGSPPPTGPAAPQMTLATGASRSEPFEQGSKLIDAMVRSGASDDQIDAALTAIGSDRIDRSKSAEVRAFLAKNPGYKGLLGAATRSVPTTGWERIAASPVGTGILSAVDAAMGGTSDEAAGAIDALVSGRPFSAAIADANAKKQAAFSTNWKSALLGNMVGGTAGYVGAGKLLGAAGLGLDIGRATPYAGAAAYNALSGAGQDNDDRTAGAVIGGLTGPLGQGLGELAAIPIGAGARAIAGSAPGRAVRRMFAASPTSIPQALNPGQRATVDAVNGVGLGDVRLSLAEAQNLGVPMSLADTAPQLSSLAGAAVRRSPDAAAYAESQLLPRGRAQIDRLGAAVDRNLGPIANLAQTSADLTQQARAAAGPLYDQAYSNPGASSVQLDDLMTRPSMKAGLQRAHGIAQEEGRDPTTLGFDLNDQGDVTLSRVPSFQTLDYVKRGLDDTLEPHRDPITGRLALNETTNAINSTKNTLLSRMDAANPDYAAARAAYAGPVQARDALARGKDAYSLSPDELGMQVSLQSPEHLAQMQTGFRSELMNRANSIRDASNPFDLTLGSPAARARVDTLYPNNSGTAELFRTRDLEGQLARTSNDILGNSKTAGRSIADKAFLGGFGPAVAVDAALASAGHAPVATMAYGLGGGAAKRFVDGHMATRAIARADQMAPLLMNPDPAASAATLDDLLAQARAYSDYARSFRPKASVGMFGARLGSALGTMPY